MIRKLKALALTGVAALALCALAAPGASALEFTAAEYPITIKGAAEGDHVYEIGGGKVICRGGQFSGSLSGPSATLTLTSVYSGCTAFGFISTIESGGCDWALSANGAAAINCGANPLTYGAANICRTTIKGQSDLTTNTYTNGKPTANTITASTTITNLHAVVHGTAFCPVATTTTTFENSKFTGSTTLECLNSKGVEVTCHVG
jgi:hypothetical protein